MAENEAVAMQFGNVPIHTVEAPDQSEVYGLSTPTPKPVAESNPFTIAQPESPVLAVNKTPTVEVNPFTATPPIADNPFAVAPAPANPFTAPIPQANQTTASNSTHVAEKPKGFRKPIIIIGIIIIVGVLSLLTVGGIGRMVASPSFTTQEKEIIERWHTAYGKDTETRDNLGLTLLHHAANNGSLAVAKYLVSRGADVNSVEHSNGWTPLHFVAEEGSVSVAKFLISKGANIHAKDKWNKTPLDLAKVKGNAAIVEYLTNAPNKTRSEYNSTKFSKTEQKAIDDFCLKYGSDVQAIKSDQDKTFSFHGGGTLLHHAAKNENLAIVRFLVFQGADIHAKDSDGWTPLHFAAWNENVEIVKFLISQGGDIHAKGKSLITPLHNAGLNKNVEIAKFLVSLGADLEARDRYDCTPLHRAGSNENVEIAKFLVSEGADIHAKNIAGHTPLDFAKAGENMDVVKYLSSLK